MILSLELENIVSKKKKPDLSGVDAFQLYFLHIARWTKRYAKQIAVVVIPVAIVVLAVVIGQMYLKKRKDERLVQVAQINQVYDQESKIATEQRDEILAQIKKLQDKENKDENKESKLKELEDKAKQVKANHDRTFEQYRNFFHSHQVTPEGWVTGMAAVSIAVEKKQYSEALQLLEELIKHSIKNDFYQAQARILFIKLLEETDKHDQALQEIKQTYSQLPDEFKPQVLLIKTRIQLVQQQNSAALATCDEIIATFATSREAEKAQSIKMLID